MGKFKEPYIEVTPSLHKAVENAAAARHMTMSQISSWVLGMSAGYISTALSKPNPKLAESVYKKLIEWLGCDIDEYVRESEEPQNTSDEDVIVGVTGIYNKLNELLTEQKRTNLLLQEMVRLYKDDSLGRKNQFAAILGTEELVRTMANDMHMTKEKVTAIFTEVKYNLED